MGCTRGSSKLVYILQSIVATHYIVIAISNQEKYITHQKTCTNIPMHTSMHTSNKTLLYKLNQHYFVWLHYYIMHELFLFLIASQSTLNFLCCKKQNKTWLCWGCFLKRGKMKWSNACLYLEIYPGYSRIGCYKLRLQKNSNKPEVSCFKN